MQSDVTFRDSAYFEIGPTQIASLKDRALAAPNKRARICLHGSHDDAIQEMVIAIVRGYPVSALRQRSGRKTYCVLDGELRVTYFTDEGDIARRVVLSASGVRPVILNCPATQWHGCEALTPTVVFLETLPGPFKPDNAEWRDWMP